MNVSYLPHPALWLKDALTGSGFGALRCFLPSGLSRLRGKCQVGHETVLCRGPGSFLFHHHFLAAGAPESGAAACCPGRLHPQFGALPPGLGQARRLARTFLGDP